MNTRVLAIAAAVIILVGAGGLFLFSRHQPTQAPQNNATTGTQATPATSNSMQSSIQDLFTSGQNKKCDFSVTAANGGTTKGTVYVSGNNANATMVMTANSKVTNTYLVRNSDTFYIWGDSLPTGIKLTMSVNDMASKMQGSQGAFNPSAKANFNCVSWSVDNSLFTPPANVRFTSMGSVTAPTGTTASQGQNPSAVCAGLTDPAQKTACENAMRQNGY